MVIGLIRVKKTISVKKLRKDLKSWGGDGDTKIYVHLGYNKYAKITRVCIKGTLVVIDIEPIRIKKRGKQSRKSEASLVKE